MPVVIEKKYKNALGDFDRMPDHWNKSMIECYNRGGVCDDCPNRPQTDVCRLKPVMLEAVRMFGKPNQENSQKPLNQTAKDLYKFLQETKGDDGYISCYYKDMAESIGVKAYAIKQLLDVLVDFGLIKYTSGTGNVPIIRICGAY